MREIIYDPISFNRPIGAIKNDQHKTFNILVKRDLNQTCIKLVIYNTYNSSHQFKYDMQFKYDIDDEYCVYSTTIAPLETGIYYYFFEVSFQNDYKIISRYNWEACITDNILPWQITVYDKEFQTPDWAKGKIMYQIFPDRFNISKNFEPKNAVNEDLRERHEDWFEIPLSPLDTPFYSAKDYFMGNLEGIYERVEYLKDLNIDIIYLNPIFESAENHRYSTANYYNIDPYLGTLEGFESLVKKFDEKNIKLILDGVFSHTGSDSIYFNKESNYPEIGAYNSTESKYYPWYKFIEYPDKYESWWGFDNLPALNKENPDYINFICGENDGVLNFWQSKGIGGWRFDVIDELPDIFIDSMRSSIKKYNPDTLMIGEVWEDASNKEAYSVKRRYLLGKQMDSVMNYPWKNAIVDFVKGKDVLLFTRRISEIINNYPTQSLDTLMNLLSTHDIERIITTLGVDVGSVPYEQTREFKLNKEQYEDAKALLKFAVFIQFTLPGIPSIYYGDEIGMQGFRDPFNRMGYDFKNIDEDILNLYKNISSFRNKYQKSFKTGFEFIDIDKSYFSYRRNDIICIVNIGRKPVILESIKDGEVIYGDKPVFFTDYGSVIAPMSTTAIKIDAYDKISIFNEKEQFKRAINLRKDNIII